MAYITGTVTGSGINDAASGHKMLLAAFNTFVTTGLGSGQNWTIKRNAVATVVSTGTNIEYIWQAPGLSGAEQIFMGLKAYQDPTADYYNLEIGVFTGYVSGNSFENQAGSSPIVGATLWNQSIQYWFVADGQRGIIVAKFSDIYEMIYIGKYLPYATPSQYPYPVYAFGSLANIGLLTRYSADLWWSSSNTYLGISASTYNGSNYPTPYGYMILSGFKGTSISSFLRDPAGLWLMPDIYPYAGITQIRNTASLSSSSVGYYSLHSIVISDKSPNVYGEFSGLYYITGFNNAVENTIVISGITYICFRDRRLTGFNDFIALRLS